MSLILTNPFLLVRLEADLLEGSGGGALSGKNKVLKYGRAGLEISSWCPLLLNQWNPYIWVVENDWTTIEQCPLGR